MFDHKSFSTRSFEPLSWLFYLVRWFNISCIRVFRLITSHPAGAAVITTTATAGPLARTTTTAGRLATVSVGMTTVITTTIKLEGEQKCTI